MREKSCANWGEFEQAIKELAADRTARQRQTKMYFSNWLFRGQANSSWRLETTLERYAPTATGARSYYDTIHGAKYHIESLTKLSWNMPRPDEYAEWLKSQTNFGSTDLPGDEYMIYLRHHGFPSPLLDWSRSAYVAAFFAFRHPTPQATHVSVYAFMEYAGHAKASSLDEPHINGRGPYVRSHRRHFLQQCEYTICTVRRETTWHFAGHESAVAVDDDDQDIMWKFNIPVTARQEVLLRLDEFNVNAYSLFGSDEALMEAVAFREFFGRGAPDPSVGVVQFSLGRPTTRDT
jgi:hypothetical protein